MTRLFIFSNSDLRRVRAVESFSGNVSFCERSERADGILREAQIGTTEVSPVGLREDRDDVPCEGSGTAHCRLPADRGHQ